MSINQRALTLTVRTRRVATLFGDLLGWGSAKSSGCFFFHALLAVLQLAFFFLSFTYSSFFSMFSRFLLRFAFFFRLLLSLATCHLSFFPLAFFLHILLAIILARAACFLLSSPSLSFCLLSSSTSCYLACSCSWLSSFVCFSSCLLLILAPSCSPCLQIFSFFPFTETLRLALLLWRAPPGSLGPADSPPIRGILSAGLLGCFFVGGL